MTPTNKAEKQDPNFNLEDEVVFETDGLNQGEDQPVTPEGEAGGSLDLEANTTNTDATATDTPTQDTQPVNPKNVAEALKAANNKVADNRTASVDAILTDITKEDPKKTNGARQARKFLFKQAEEANTPIAA